jgi:hypothetical protein
MDLAGGQVMAVRQHCDQGLFDKLEWEAGRLRFASEKPNVDFAAHQSGKLE